MFEQKSSARSCELACWLLLALMLAAFASFQIADPFSLAGGSALPFVGLAVLLLGTLYGRVASMPRLQAASTAFLQITSFTLIGVALSYAVAAQAGPLSDAQLAAADRALELDWTAVARLLDTPVLALLCLLAYHSLIPQMVAAVVALSARSDFVGLRSMVFAALFAGFATILISWLIPAYGNLLDPADYDHLRPSLAWLHREEIAGLRDGSMRVVNLSAMTGIVTFPSYHAALAAIFMWSFRRVPKLASVGTIWALLTITATPIGGGHYGVDVIGGVLLGIVSLCLARALATIRGWSHASRGGQTAANTWVAAHHPN